MARHDVLGIGFDPLPLAQVPDAVAALIRRAQQEGSLLIATPNPEIVMAARRDAHLRRVLHEAALVLPDGVGIVWAARRLGRPVPERVTGVDALPGILARAARDQWRLYLLGAKPGVAEQAAANMRRQYANLRIVGVADGYFAAEQAAARVAAVRAARPDLLLLAMGAPREQFFWDRWRDDLGPVVAMGVGGSLDIYAGTVRRAPLLVRRLGLEWLWRLLREPRRLGRQLRALPLFAVLVLWQSWRGAGEQRGRG